MNRACSFGIAVAAAALAQGVNAASAQTFPTRPVRIVN